jgi:hypothetical protein
VKPKSEFQHLLDFMQAKPGIDRAGCFAYSARFKAAAANDLDGNPLPERVARRAPCAVHGGGGSDFHPTSCMNVWARRCRCWWIRRRAWAAKGGVGRSYADAPEIDGLVVHLLPPEKVSKTLKVGEFTKRTHRGRTQGHDLAGLARVMVFVMHTDAPAVSERLQDSGFRWQPKCRYFSRLRERSKQQKPLKGQRLFWYQPSRWLALMTWCPGRGLEPPRSLRR